MNGQTSSYQSVSVMGMLRQLPRARLAAEGKDRYGFLADSVWLLLLAFAFRFCF